MLVNSEFLAWLNSQTKPARKEDKGRPLVRRGEKITKSAQDKSARAGAYEGEAEERGSDAVEYLNERKTNFSLVI